MRPRSFFAHALAGCGEFGDSANRGGFRSLATGVGVNLGIKHEDVDVLAGGEYVVETAETDVVGCAVAGDNPLRALHDEVLQDHYAVAYVAAACLAERNDGFEYLAGGFCAVAVVEPFPGLLFDFCGAAVAGEGLLHEAFEAELHLLVGDGHAQTELGEVLEERVGPCGAVTAEVGGVGGGGHGAGVDRGAAGGVGYHLVVAEELGYELHVGSLAATRACA